MYIGTCDCFDAQWTGSLCDICSDTFYGPDCQALLTVLNVIPNQGLDKGENDVHVWGHNFPETDTYYCKFDTDVVNGVWVAWNHVVCSAPRHADGIVSIEISPDGLEYSNNKVILFRHLIYTLTQVFKEKLYPTVITMVSFMFVTYMFIKISLRTFKS